MTAYTFGAVLALAASAQAQEPWPKWYVGLSGLVPYVQEADVTVAGTGVGDLDFQTGWGFNAAIGYYLTGPAPGGFRMDLEYSMRENSLDRLGSVSISDDVSVQALMLNAYYDIHTDTQWLPYVGGGLGYADVELNAPAIGTADDGSSELAYQLMAGIGYQPSVMPRTTWSLGYRYFGTTDPSFDGTAGRVETEYNNHSFEFGGRFSF